VPSQARNIQDPGLVRVQAAGTVAPYDLRQMPDGSAGVYDGTATVTAGQYLYYTTVGTFNVVKDATASILKGGPVYWDYSANQATFRRVDDRDFYIGRAHQDAAQSDTIVVVELNENPRYEYDLGRDPFTTAPTGTQALGGFLPPQGRGGALAFLLSATNEAQKVDALAKDGFAADGADAIVEIALNLISAGAGAAPDFNIGLASATHATDADSIAQHLFCHLDGNASAIKFQSKDGTNTTAATDSTKTITAGAGNANRVEVWFDLRDPTSVKLYVNGVQVLTGTTFNVSAAAARWLPLVHLEKTAAADQFQIDIDWFRVRSANQ